MVNDRRQEDKAQGRFEGMVIEKLDALQDGLNEIKEDHRLFKRDTYDRINRNTKDIASQKGWMGAIGAFAGIAGGFLKGLIFK